MKTFLQILFFPREVFPRLSTSTKPSTALLLAALSGVERGFRNLYKGSLDVERVESAEAVFASTTVVGVATGVTIFWTTSQAYAWVCRKLGGDITQDQMLRVLGWSMVPSFSIIPAVVWLYCQIGDHLFIHSSNELLSLHKETVFRFLLVYLTMLVWTIRLAVVGLSAVAQIGGLRALWVYFLGGVVVFLLFLIENRVGWFVAEWVVNIR